MHYLPTMWRLCPADRRCLAGKGTRIAAMRVSHVGSVIPELDVLCVVLVPFGWTVDCDRVGGLERFSGG